LKVQIFNPCNFFFYNYKTTVNSQRNLKSISRRKHSSDFVLKIKTSLFLLLKMCGILCRSQQRGPLVLQENFPKDMLLSQSNKVLGIYEMSQGGIAGTVMDIRMLFATALKAAVVGIILIHNHPSGKTMPSDVDRQITAKIVQAGKFLDINILDHLIITPELYFSFADSGDLG